MKQRVKRNDRQRNGIVLSGPVFTLTNTFYALDTLLHVETIDSPNSSPCSLKSVVSRATKQQWLFQVER